MSKRALKRLEMCICFMLCAIFLGHFTAFADEVKPVHEYNFDNDEDAIIYDSVKNGAINGSTNINKLNNLVTGYNGEGLARHYQNSCDVRINYKAMPKGEKSIRFQIKKDPSTVNSSIVEPIFTTCTTNNSGFYIGIGYLNTPVNGGLLVLNQDKGKVNFELHTPNSVCDGNWHDILFTWDGTSNANSLKLYVDMVLVAQATPTSDEIYVSEDIQLACRKESNPINNKLSYAYNYWGDLDNLQIYALAITPEDLNPVRLLNLKATAGNSKIDLTWDSVEKATSYTIKRSTTAGGPYIAIATDLTGTSYTDTDVTSGTTYYYIVSATNNGTEIANSNEASAEPIADQTPPATEAKLKVVLEVAESLRLSVDDDLNINTQMSWSSSEPTVATVNEKGIVTALAPGNTVITVKSVDGSYTDYINVLVVENADDYRLAIDLKVGETARLTADDFTNTANITWAPMDSSIANVTSKGKVTALSKGLVLISAKDADGNIIGRVYVRVRE